MFDENWPLSYDYQAKPILKTGLLESETGELIYLEVCVRKIGKLNFWTSGQESCSA